MGSIESLSSHSSELNNSSKTSSSQHHVQREKGDNGIPWVQTPATLPGLKNTVVWTTSPESSSSEDTVKTDGLSDSQNLLSAAGNKPPPLSLCSEGPHKHNVLKRSITTSLTSLPITDGTNGRIFSNSVQNLSSVDLKDTLKITSNPALPPKMATRRRLDSTASNGYQKPGSVVASRTQLFENIGTPKLNSSRCHAKAMYACKAEHSHELSFPQGAVFTNVHSSVEPGWLQGTYEGKTGLIPANYIVFL